VVTSHPKSAIVFIVSDDDESFGLGVRWGS